MLADTSALPTNAGYVAAAYLVFLAMLLIYVGIMAYKLTGIRRDISEIDELVDRRIADGTDDAPREREETVA
jgi:hypothetical protein